MTESNISIERTLGRIEQQVLELHQNRARIDAMSERLMTLEHGSISRHEAVTGDLQALTIQSAATSDSVQGLSERVTSLEAPVLASTASRAKFRAKWKKRMAWAMSMAIAVWALADPFCKVLLSNVATRWLANGFPFHP